MPRSTAVAVNASEAATDGVPLDLKKKELIDLIVAASERKPRDVRPVVDAMLKVLGDTVAGGRGLNLHPFGKLRIVKANDRPNAEVLTCKIRRSKSADGSAE